MWGYRKLTLPLHCKHSVDDDAMPEPSNPPIALRPARARTHLHGVESSGGSRVGMYHRMRPSKQNLAFAGVIIKITNGWTRHHGFGIGTPEDLRQRNQCPHKLVLG